MTGGRELTACLALSAALGVVHVFSLFIMPLEAAFGESRATVSLTYSIALVALTIMVLAGSRIYGLLRPSAFVTVVGSVAIAGILIAAFAEGLPEVWLGYGLMFGAANGAGYGFALQLAARARPERPGLAMGLVTAFYALGATATPPAFSVLLERFGLAGALIGHAVLVALAAGLAVGLLWGTPVRVARGEKTEGLPEKAIIGRFWVSYGLAVFAGLMAISQAAEIARAAGAAAVFASLAPAVLALANMGGALLGGWAIDRARARPVLAVLPGLSVIALGLLMFSEGAMVLAGLALVGFAYGAIIAAYPAAIARRFEGGLGVRVYGLVFTAWGAAGLAAPLLAGALFDLTGAYSAALLLALGCGAASAVVAFVTPEGNNAVRGIN